MKEDYQNIVKSEEDQEINNSFIKKQVTDDNKNESQDDMQDNIIIPLPISKDKANIPFIPKGKKTEIDAQANPITNKIKSKNEGEPDEIDNIINQITKNKKNKKGNVTFEKNGNIKFEEEPKTVYGNTITNYLVPGSAKNKSNNSFGIPLIKQDNEVFETGIDPYVINNNNEITNSDIILCILEICLNPHKFKLKYSPKSKVFWDSVLKKPNIQNIFKNFKPETLKKYWLILVQAKNFNQVIDLVNTHKELINNKKIK